jgi:alkylhydroperoxidase/carboxymuconolactone decarboxylase family protein YurZ
MKQTTIRGDEMQSADTQNFGTMLSRESLQALRDNFRDDALEQPSLAALVAPFPARATPYAKPYIEALLGVLYADRSQSALTALERELIITTTLAVNGHGSGAFLGIHLYWSLMVGIRPEKLAEQLLVISIYNGVDTLSASFKTLGALLSGLDTWARHNSAAPEKLKAGAVIGQILSGFAGNTPPPASARKAPQRAGGIRKVRQK